MAVFHWARSETIRCVFISRFVHGGGLSYSAVAATILPPSCNWICARGLPTWNDATGALCGPCSLYRTVGAVHLAGTGKTKAYSIRCIQG